MGDWKDGFPIYQGWYNCMIDGEEIRLLHKVCQLTMKHKWYDETGEQVHDAVRWRGDPQRC